MNSVLAFTIIMLVWTVSDYISKKTKSLLSTLLIASLIFLIGFKTNLFPEDLLPSSSLLALGTTVVGFILVHLGTTISLKEFKQQWRTFLIGVAATLGIVAALLLVGPLFEDQSYAIAAIGAISGGTISIIMVQDAAIAAGLLSVAVLPVLISAFQGLIGFPLTSLILRKEANRLHQEYQENPDAFAKAEKVEEKEQKKTRLPELFHTTAGTLFVVGVTVLLATFVNNLTNGMINTFILCLLFGIALRELNIFKPNILNGIDAYGLMMLAILIIIFGPLATISIHDLIELILPLTLSFLVGVTGNVLFAAIAGKFLGYSLSMSIAIGLTSLYGFPGTMILSQEAAKSINGTPEEIALIEGQILPKMVIAGFSTVTITSVFITGILVNLIG
ncbi:hypothetical protein UAW_02546 [Enterococcus haemoperoxidus ATCC BAA-382]|uniref:Uncharacterized protein n=1 Tax=Enterococcus haemoperoxidus ATCC BAA-382 TaxID=1158608 RepID=R2QDK0_9ENTE|nr:hypothetical protein [Enterococcus haemoperoxidus]EOH93298.1 hypothetical protein UAW_02546 [Enterococcus haemoperoxidus ATCC BAA-382]EOT61253.1 hypothetical protein I583_00231 [Enterococcus haemoperoxidus ATCC BAA-382]